MTKKKKLLIGTLAICLVAALAIGGTLAFLTDTDQATNVFTIGDDIEIELTEPGWNDGDGDDLFPGDSMEKDPTITGIAGESYARLVVTLIDQNEMMPNSAYVAGNGEDEFIVNTNKGMPITDTTRIAKILQTIYYDKDGDIDTDEKYTSTELTGLALPHFNADDFTLDALYSSAGVYCYNYVAVGGILDGILEENEEATLFTHIVIPSDWVSADMTILGDYAIDVVAQAIQTTGFDNATDAYAALDAQLNPQP